MEAIVSSLVTAAVLGLCSFCYKRWNDRVRLTTALSTINGIEVHQKVGCDCVILTVKNRGQRVAKISKAILGIDNVDLIPKFEEAFGASFGYVPVEGAPPPYATIDLVPMKEPDCSDGYILERDDVVRFAIPALAPFLIFVPKAKSQDVWLAIEFFDDERQVLIRGLKIQEMVRTVIQMCAGTDQKLKLGMTGNLHANSAVPPGNSALLGMTNPNSLTYMSQKEAKELQERLDIQEAVPDIRVPVYVLATQEKSEVIVLTTEHGYVLPILGSMEIVAEHLPHFLVPVQVREIATFEMLRSFVACRVGNAKTDRKTLILFDTFQAGERVMSSIPIEVFLAAIPSSTNE